MLTRLLTCFLLILLLPSFLGAQPMSDLLNQEIMKRAIAQSDPATQSPQLPDPTQPKKSDPMIGAHAFYLGGAGADIASTIRGQNPKYGLSEKNPLLSGLPVKAQIPVGAGIEALAYVLARKLLKENHPKIFKAGLIGAGAAHSLAAVNNLRLQREQ